MGKRDKRSFADMEFVQEHVFSTNLIAWLLVVVLVVFGFKFLMTAGKGLIYAICMLVIFCILYRFFPEFVAPVLEFIAPTEATNTTP